MISRLRRINPSLTAQHIQLRALGDRARDNREHGRAVTFYLAYLAHEPNDAAIQIQCGHMLKESGDLKQAAAHYEAARLLTPDDADLHIQIGHLRKLSGDNDGAVEAYGTAVGLDPANADAARHLEFVLSPAARVSDALLQLPAVGSWPTTEPSRRFADDLYLATHGDVTADGLPQPGMRHWISIGGMEDLRGTRARVPDFVENIYLRDNLDVSAVVGTGLYPSGYHHFLNYGYAEGRPWSGGNRQLREQAILEAALVGRMTMDDWPDGVAQPVISIIVPVYCPPSNVLRECIESVRRQSYPHWELCLADDGSQDPETAEILLAAQAGDGRIKVGFTDASGGIAAASNRALVMATGEFVALLDHDDILAPDALFQLARAFTSSPDTDMVYSDEAKLSEDGKPFALNLKPSWSPHLLLSTMYVGHLTAYRRAMVDQVGGFRAAFDGTQDYDLALRMAEVVRQVRHIAEPLYFWRLSPASTAGSMGAKPGVLIRQQAALQAALARRQLSGIVKPGHSPGHWSVILDPPAGEPMVSIVIPSAGRTAVIGDTMVDLVLNCVRSLVATETYPNYEIVVVHNGDLRKATLDGLAKFPCVRLVHYDAAAFNLSDKINLGVRSGRGEYTLLLNDDMQVESSGVIRSMLGCMFPGVGIVGGRLLYAKGTLQHAGVIWTEEGPTHAMVGEHRLTAGPAERLCIRHECFGVSGACMFFRRELFLETGGFPAWLPLNYNDVQFCTAIRSRGLQILFNPDVTIYHFESVSKTGTFFWELQALAISAPGVTDPYFNPRYAQRSPFYELADERAVQPPSYVAWLLRRMIVRNTRPKVAEKIRFSFILSVYENQPAQMAELEATIMHQVYDNWEWIIVDDGCKAAGTLAWLERVKSRPKVTLIRHAENSGIMAGYGTAFRAAKGDYVVPVDADDIVTLDCLRVLADAIEKNGSPDIVFSDEDKVGESGLPRSPFLKPDWDPVLFTNVCYVCHVCAVKRSTAQQVGAYSDLDAAWCHDWDTLMRVHQAGGFIVHVPEVLYSWRIHSGSTASIETGTKPHTLVSQRHVLERHLKVSGLDRWFRIVTNTLFPHAHNWRLRWRGPEAPETAVIVLVDRASPELGQALLELGRAASLARWVTLVGDGAIIDEQLRSLPPELLERVAFADGSAKPQTQSLAQSIIAATQAGFDNVMVLGSNAATFSQDWLLEGLGMFHAAPDVAAVGGQVLLPNQTVAWRGGYRGFGGSAGSPDYGLGQSDGGFYGMGLCQRSCDAVPSVCFLAKATVLRQALDRLEHGTESLRRLAGAVAEVAWGSGQRIIYTPFMQVGLRRPASVEPILSAESLSGKVLSTFYHPMLGQSRHGANRFAPDAADAGRLLN